MKNILIITLTLSLFPFFTNAEETNYNSKNNLNIKNSLTNPLVKPLKSEFHIKSDINYYKREYNLENNTTNAKISDRKEEGIMIMEGFQYGISDKWTLDLQITYDHYTDHNSPVAQSTQEYDYSGFENPKFGFEWRAMDNKSGKIDLSLSWAPDIFDRETTTDSVYEGAPVNGRHELEFFTRYGQDFKHFAIATTAKATYLDTTKYTQLNGKIPFRESKRMKYEAILETEYRLIKKLTANTNIGYIWNTESDLENHYTALVQKNQPGNIGYVTMQFNYSFIPEFTLSTYYTYENIEETYLKYKSGPATADQVREDDRKDIYGIKTVFRF
jgi:hypothetical protein